MILCCHYDCSLETQSTSDTPMIQCGEEIAMTLLQRQCLTAQLQKVILD